jgi:hypothetical protein
MYYGIINSINHIGGVEDMKDIKKELEKYTKILDEQMEQNAPEWRVNYYIGITTTLKFMLSEYDTLEEYIKEGDGK